MGDFLQMNLNRLSGIRDTAGRIAGERSGRRAERSRNIFDAFKTGAGVYTQGAAAKKLADAKAIEADKGRTAQNRAAARLADERGGVRDWERGQGFLNKKELKQMEITARDSLARLEAELRKEGTDGDFNIDNAYMAAMAYGLAPVGKWEGPTWRPESWTEEDRAAVIRRIETVLSRYDIGQASQVMEMVMADLDMYDLPEDPEVSEGEGRPIVPRTGRDYIPQVGALDLGQLFKIGTGDPSLTGAQRAGINIGPTRERATAMGATSQPPPGMTLEQWQKALKILNQ